MRALDPRVIDAVFAAVEALLPPRPVDDHPLGCHRPRIDDRTCFIGIVYRGPGHDRRAALAGGPDVWEIVTRLRELEGSEEQRIAVLATETELHPRQLRAALEFAARNPAEIEHRIVRNERAIAESRDSVAQRRALLA